MASILAPARDQPEKCRIVETYDVEAVFDETDPRSIAKVVNDRLGDEDRYRQMCRNARHAAREKLNWAVEEEKSINHYRSLQTDQ
jgi:glycosyltransferase involved in cell wall biosynthesis